MFHRTKSGVVKMFRLGERVIDGQWSLTVPEVMLDTFGLKGLGQAWISIVSLRRWRWSQTLGLGLGLHVSLSWW